MHERNSSLSARLLSAGEVPLTPEQRINVPITVLCGGDSSERPGSIKSGETVAGLLRQFGYKYVSKLDVTANTVRDLTSIMPAGVAFMTMHGGFGEDGTLQGMLDMLDIPYTGSGVAASAISADKVIFSRFIRGLGYNVADQLVVDSAADLEKLDLEYPKVIKPATQGCSYGVFFIRDKSELLDRAPYTGQFSDRIILEDYIPGRELTVGIFENPHSHRPSVLPITENILSREILDFEAKVKGGEHLYRVVIPADLDQVTRVRIEEIGSDIFQKMNCRGYVRMDMRLTESGEIFVIENNTSPGMLSLSESDFPKMLQAGGVDPTKFVDLMVEASLLNYQKKLRNNSRTPTRDEMLQYFKSRA